MYSLMEHHAKQDKRINSSPVGVVLLTKFSLHTHFHSVIVAALPYSAIATAVLLLQATDQEDINHYYYE